MKWITLIKGFLMGMADVIPGVSGGTIAFITGIYPRLIHALSTIDLSFVKFLVRFKFGKAWKIIQKIDWNFLLPLGTGIAAAIFTLSKLMQYLLAEFTALTYAFFFGLILASAIFLYRINKKFGFEHAIFLALGFVFAYVIAGAAAVGFSHNLPTIFVAGVLAISAMILPGISGAFILVLLNQYEYLVNALHDFEFIVAGTFILGACVGLLGFSKVLDYVLRRHRSLTIATLIGVMIGSLRVPWQRITESQTEIGFVLLWAIIGGLIVIILEKLSRR
jgi:putative membrane protein